VRMVTFRNSALSAMLALLVSLWWYRSRLLPVVLTTPVYVTLNFSITLAATGLSHGMAGLLQELRGIGQDLMAPYLVCFRLLREPPLPLRRQYEQVVLALCLASSYTYAYGMLSQVMIDGFVKPVDQAWQLSELLWHSQLPPLAILAVPCTVVCSHVAHQLLISCIMHRYFSHHAFGASRLASFMMAVGCCAAQQRGPLWWASTHRHHHTHCDTTDDPHSPVIVSFWCAETLEQCRHKPCRSAVQRVHPISHRLRTPCRYAHVGWLIDRRNFAIRREWVSDWLERSPELLLADLFFSQARPPCLLPAHLGDGPFGYGEGEGS